MRNEHVTEPAQRTLRCGRAAALLLAAALVAGVGESATPETPETPEPPLAIELQGILGSKAVLLVNGERHVLGPGDSAGGVRLEAVAAARDAVSVTVDGETRRLELGSRVTRGYTQREERVARIYADRRGMYVAIGAINGFATPMLLDTGATFVAMDSNTANRLGVNHRLRGTPITVNTAAGPAPAYEVRLESVAVGEITLRGIEAFVIEGRGPGIPLLGMSFLRRLEVSTESGTMVLRARQ